jgi:hypothetical protein
LSQIGFNRMREKNAGAERCNKSGALIADGEAAEDDMFIFLVPRKPMNGGPD